MPTTGSVSPRIGRAPQSVADGDSLDYASVPWMSVAMMELNRDTEERAGQSENNPRVLEYFLTTQFHAHRDEVPWCSAFVNWVLKQSGFEGTQSAAAASWLGGKGGTPITQPRYGAITIVRHRHEGLDRESGRRRGNHVAFLVEWTPKAIRLLGGNQDDQVEIEWYELGKIEVLGYRWPR